jgi:hypothetical protein
MERRKMTTFKLNDCLTFGKYKDYTVKEIIKDDPDYLAWALDEIDWFELDEEAEEKLDAVMLEDPDDINGFNWSNKPQGIIEITGDHDAGKTLASLFVNYPQGVPLKRIAFFHDDVKAPGYPQKEFGLFVDLVKETYGLKLFEYRQFVLDKIEKIKSNEFDAIVFDTWPKFGESLRNYVIANRYEFRAKSEFIMQHDLRVVGSQSWKDAHNYEADIAGQIASKTGCLIVTSHLKDHYAGGAKTGKQIDELGKAWNKICNLRLWLRHNKDSGVPIILVLKRVHKGTIEKGLPMTVDVLPRRIKPMQDEKSIWEAINRYWQEPVGNRPLLEDEKPTPFELSILDGTLTDDQKEVWRAELKAEQEREIEEQAFIDNKWQEAQALALELAQAHDGLPTPLVVGKILPDVQKEYPDYTKNDVAQMLV